ncbi:hypothetical protein NLU13_6114 [Sarocladium strictum]|uniref:Uncharacterized protein n=1 Tax=Sarocladium strictum TaxID=5046 RepID=A0AA39GHP0_SARSR|nr:hypothetical protein NLU13_6114 [Sarocladium strictum]
MSQPSAQHQPLSARKLQWQETMRVLIVVAGGGYTNAAPLLELGQLLSSRGYEIEFASLQGRETWVKDCAFVTRFHSLGPAVPAPVEEAKYLEMSTWSSDNWGAKTEARKFLESSWPDVYLSLSRLVNDAQTRPDFLLAEYWVDAARDVSFEHDIPLAMHWSQMPTAILHATYIPGTPGLQAEILSSEHASFWQRSRSSVAIYGCALHYYRYLQWRKRMRATAGIHRALPTLSKPDYLCSVHSLFGVEVAKDLPPSVAAVGPILSDSVPELQEPCCTFLAKRSRVLYIFLGTHVLLPWASIEKLLCGALAVLASGGIDGIIWPMRSMARKQLNLEALLPVSAPHSSSYAKLSELLSGAHPAVLLPEFAPQRSLLQDERVAVFLSHGGPASANEALYAGVPLVTIAVYFDQAQNEMRLRDAGGSIPLDKDDFSAQEVGSALDRILQDKDAGGPISANVERMQRIAMIASRRKHLAVGLVEEVLVDHQWRRRERLAPESCLGDDSTDSKPRFMHLQTADVRMSTWKARNWDLLAANVAVVLCVAGLLVAVPVAVTQTLH